MYFLQFSRNEIKIYMQEMRLMTEIQSLIRMGKITKWDHAIESYNYAQIHLFYLFLQRVNGYLSLP